jgi:hypothetical protein
LSRKGLSACLKGIDRIFLSYFVGKQIGPGVSNTLLIEIITISNVKGSTALKRRPLIETCGGYQVQAAIKRRAEDNVPRNYWARVAKIAVRLAFCRAALFSRLTDGVERSYLLAIAISARAESSPQSW